MIHTLKKKLAKLLCGVLVFAQMGTMPCGELLNSSSRMQLENNGSNMKSIPSHLNLI